MKRKSLAKRGVILLTAVMMAMTAVCGCRGIPREEETIQGDTGRQADGELKIDDGELKELAAIYDEIEPLEKETTLRYAGGVGNQLVIPLYLAWESGGLEKLGITLDFYPSATGPLSVEALTAGEVDFAGSGIAGIAVGCANGNTRMLCYLADDSVAQKFYVQKDHPLAGKPFNETTGFVGTAEDWKGLEVYMPSGSTLQYVMSVGLEKLGLTLQDITPVYMNAENVNTALYAKKGEVWGLWNFLCYSSDLEKDYAEVMDGHSIGVDLVTAYFTNDQAWNNPQTRAALEKIMEVHFKTLEWIQSDEKHMETAAKMMTIWCEEEGTAVSYEENLGYLKDTYYYSLEENLDYFSNTVENENGTMLKAVDMLMGIMDFYVEQGNYTENDRKNMIKNQEYLFIKEGLQSLQ